MSDRAFRIGPIRPPSEARSLLIQITQGCTWNKCYFCSIYRDTKFKAFSADSIRKDIDNIKAWADIVNCYHTADGRWDLDGLNYELGTITDEADRQSMYTVANWLVGGGETVFLQDGNSIALSSGRLTDVLKYLKETFPQIKRITSYGRAENLSHSTAEEYAELKEAGLDRIHSGYETGSDAVLTRVNKGLTQKQQIEAGKAIRGGGIELSIYFMPGLGGKDLSESNAVGTAEVINAVQPEFVRVRTTSVKPGTELYDLWQDGVFELASDDDKVREIRRIIELVDDGNTSSIVSDHMVNLLQDIDGVIADDREMLLGRIDKYLEMPETERKIFQHLRRTLKIYDLEDMARLTSVERDYLSQMVSRDTDREWDIKMNNYVGRYI